MRTLLRQDDTMIAVESGSAIVDYADILEATKVVPDDFGDTPWEACDGYEHTVERAHWVEGNDQKMRGYCYCDAQRTQIVIQLPGADYGLLSLYEWLRERGASKQVAREAVAADRRRTLDQLVHWYSEGWQWLGVKCDFEVLGEEFHDSIWGIDDDDYARKEVVPEIADTIADQLEAAGFTVNNRPERVYPSRKDKQARLHYNLALQNWKN